MLLPLGHISNSLPLALESIIQLHAFLTPMVILCCSCFASGRAFITGFGTLQIFMLFVSVISGFTPCNSNVTLMFTLCLYTVHFIGKQHFGGRAPWSSFF